MSGWSIPINVLAERANVRVETIARKIAYSLFRSVVLKSPVDTGRFRANWNFSNGTPDYTTSTNTDQSRGSDQAAMALTASLGGMINLANGLPYGQRLEYEGWSKQAPQGMIRISIAELQQSVAAAVASTE